MHPYEAFDGATNFGGKRIDDFTQSSYVWKTVAGEGVGGGACITLCTLWAKNDFTPTLGGRKAFLQDVKDHQDSRDNIATTQHKLTGSTIGAQRSMQNDMLREVGLAPSSQVSQVLWANYKDRGEFGDEEAKKKKFLQDAAQSILHGDTHGYRLITIENNPAPHHALAARYFGEELEFFDPNGGVIRFDNPQDLSPWFSEYYVPNCYERVYGFRIRYFVPSPSTTTTTFFWPPSARN